MIPTCNPLIGWAAVVLSRGDLLFRRAGDRSRPEYQGAPHLDVPVIVAAAALPHWAGPVTDGLDGKSMDVDWVRAYQKKDSRER